MTATEYARGGRSIQIVTATVTIVIQLVVAAYVYGQLSALVAIHSKEIEDLRRDKLDADIYYREHPNAPLTGGGAKP